VLWLALLLSFQIPPRPQTAVNDYAHVLQPAQRDQLETKLRGTQVVVAIFPSLEGEEVRDISVDIARKWGVGQKGQDNGVLLALYAQEHKWDIEVGYGAEPVLTDLQAHQVGVETLVPRLRQGDWYGALDATTQRILDILNRKAVAPRVVRRQPQPPLSPLLILIAIIAIGALVSRRRGTLGGGGWSSLPWWFWWFGGGGRGGGGGWGGGGGGDWGGGGGGGDSGNFGGGDFGGGGASGDW